MTSAPQLHEEMLSALRDKKFQRLAIKRMGEMCYLVIFVKEQTLVFADHSGRKKEYRHAWQIRTWLKDSFGVPPDSVPVELIEA